MAPPPDETPTLDDPRLEGGEWLFRKDEQVFGPVDSRALAAMLYRGDLEARTLVSPGDGSWRAVSDISIFLVHAKKAQAALAVEREVTGARLLAARRGRRRAVALGILGLLLTVGVVGGAFVLARRRATTSALLEDFGAGISVASAARVGVSHHGPQDDLVEVPLDPAAPGRPAPSRGERVRERQQGGRGPATATGDVAGGELVAAEFDERKIQAVVAREQRTLVPCFRDESARSPEFAGDVPLEFTIGNDGRVASLWIADPRLREGALRECLLRALGAWRFDSFPGQRPTVSLAFRIGR